MRRALPVLLVVACRGSAPSASDAAAGSSPSVAEDAAPPPLAGRVEGRELLPRKVYLQRWPTTTVLFVGNYSLHVDPCRFEIPPDEDAAYVELRWDRAARSGDVVSRGITVRSRHDRKAAPRVRVIIHQIENGRAKGELDYRESAETFLAGAFEAVDCPSRVVARDVTAPVHGVVWSKSPPAEIPNLPARGFLFGNAFEPKHVAWKDAQLVFFEASPVDPCAELGKRSGVAVGVRRVAATSKASVATGKNVAQLEDVGGFVQAADGVASVVVDAIDKTSVRGRVYAAFDDASTSLLVGAFSAHRCGS